MNTFISTLWIGALAAPSSDASALGGGGGPDLPDYGGLLLKTLLALILVILLAWVALRWGLKRLVPGGNSGPGQLRVLARQPLDGRRSIVLVEAYGRYLLLGLGDGPVTLITELDASDVAAATGPPLRSFGDLLRDKFTGNKAARQAAQEAAVEQASTAEPGPPDPEPTRREGPPREG